MSKTAKLKPQKINNYWIVKRDKSQFFGHFTVKDKVIYGQTTITIDWTKWSRLSTSALAILGKVGSLEAVKCEYTCKEVFLSNKLV